MAAHLDDHLADLFAPLGGVAVRRMFGGLGIFRDGLMIAIVIDEVLYLKSDELTRAAFEAEGCEPFTYMASGKRRSLGYRRLPERLLDDADDFLAWAEAAMAVARRADAAKRPRRRKAGVVDVP